MKLRLFLIPSIFTLAIMLFISACDKEGPAGATGPAGPAGPAGPTGASGANGAAGTTGTANVIYSDWLNVTFDGSAATGWKDTIAAPNLVDSILSKGEIKVYWNSGSDSIGGQLIYPLPINDPFINAIDINAYFKLQSIILRSTADVGSYVLRNYNYSQFRYILIPGGKKAGRGVKTIDWNNYKEVQQYLGLKD